ncbi:phage holin, LLH family [Natranaerofaba carboxydovora]|uniref:phage holin, LLH family n=1 Tax=Natranaerofaba carboxydovora TaxID=2742683 RepID=UPI001F130157|nr:phage holin, LLH family [Natranaerofaba carboxydovora]UMZ74083.1 Bacteriophage holin of superfamily 6 (Holin_LLH) [Natranaerofaba carboxydovora]
MEEILFDILKNVLLVLSSALAAYLASWVKNKIGKDMVEKSERELQMKKDLARITVGFIEQSYNYLNGQDKLSAGSRWLESRFKDLGLKYSNDEIRGLIEAALREFKSSYKEEWLKNGESSE